MATYTLIQSQYDELLAGARAFDSSTLAILRSLKPNSQEPVGEVEVLRLGYGDTNRLDWRIKWAPKRGPFGRGTKLYIHPAPMIKKDMVRVLEALQGNRGIAWQEKYGAWSLSKEITPAPTHEAIDIMQSAIEGME